MEIWPGEGYLYSLKQAMKEMYSSRECRAITIQLEGLIALSDPVFNNPYQNPDTGMPEELEW